MGISDDLPYKIEYDNPHYERSLRSLNASEISDLLQKIEMLRIDPHDIGKQLRKPHEGKYSMRIYGKRYRLIFMINDSARKVKLIHVYPHVLAYRE